MAEALYNKYRPQIFEDVVGQEHIERTLKNAIASDKISHAYLFTGPRGTGKTTTARLLSKALICEKGPTPDPDGTCEDCELIAAGEHPDVYELDAASRTGVENVREEIIGKVNYAPTRGRYKVYIIDEVHMLSTAAFNALLKTLEEPPAHVVFVLCTTDPQKVPETILSRCQRFDFRRIASEELISRLGAICEMEGVRFEGDALDLIAHRAQGGMRDALTSLDQLIAFGEGEVTTVLAERLLGSLDSSDLADIVRAIGERDAAACFRWTSEYMETGADLVQFVNDLTEHMRDMYVMSLAGADVALELTEAARRELEVELSWYGPERLSRMLGVLGDLTNELKTSTNQRLSFEVALTRMVRPESDLTLASLAERIEALERGAGGSASAGVAAGAGAGSANVGDGVGAGAQGERARRTLASAGQSVREGGAMAQQPDGAGTAPSPQAEQGGAASQAVAQDAAPSQGAAQASAAVDPGASGAAGEPFAAAADGASPAGGQGVPASQQAAQGQTGAASDAAKMWASVLAHLKKIGPAFGVIFMNTAPSVQDGKLVITFDASSDFAFKAAQKQDAREALERALERAGMGGMPYEIAKGEVGQARAVQAEPAAAEPAVAEPAAQAEAADARAAQQQAQQTQQAQQAQPAQQAQQAQSAQPAQQTPQAQQAAQAAQPAVQAEPAQHARPADAEAQQTQPAQQAQPAQQGQAAPQQEQAAAADPDFQDFLASAFGEGIVIEEMQE